MEVHRDLAITEVTRLLDYCINRFIDALVSGADLEREYLVDLYKSSTGHSLKPVKEKTATKKTVKKTVKKTATKKTVVEDPSVVSDEYTYVFIESFLAKKPTQRRLISAQKPPKVEPETTTISIRLNSHNNLMHKQTKLVFDRVSKKVIGRQGEDETPMKLTKDDLNMCSTWGFEYDESCVAEESPETWESMEDDAVSVHSE